jgi:hypothetical protein
VTVTRVAAAVKTGDDQEDIGFAEEEERIGESLRLAGGLSGCSRAMLGIGLRLVSLNEHDHSGH